MLNIVLLIACVLTAILLLLYLFYWNRVLALVISIVLRIAFWNQAESSIWLDIGAVQFSVIAGRIAFKDLRYYSSNQTIRVVKGQISWRYWIRKPAEEDLSHAHVLGEDPKQTVHLPLSCRVHLSLQGFEWFIYNRTAAYENILSQMADDVPPTPAPTPAVPSISLDARSTLRKMFSRTSTTAERGAGPSLFLTSSLYLKAPSHVKRLVSWIRLQLPNFDPKNLLPMGIEVSKGAIICGNASTPNLLVAEFSKAEGTYGIVQARSKYDLYKQLLNLKFENTSVHYFENADFDARMADVGLRLREHIERSGDIHMKHPGFLTYLYYYKLWTRLKLWSVESTSHARARSFVRRLFGRSVPVPHPPTSWAWWRAPKAPEDETPIGADFSKLEYAIERKILEAPTLEILYYADVVGIVPAEPSRPSTDSSSLDPFDIGNGDLPPEWGIDFVVKGGFLRYGPWADRQRAILQSCFFPPSYHDAEAGIRLKPGDTRTWTGLKVFIELRDGVTLHVPFREASKDWQWDGKVDVPDRPRRREAAFIHVKAGDSSTISYIMPMVASATGFHPLLEVHLDTLTVTSSLNDMRLLIAQSCRVRCQLPTPLQWNGERTWTFSVLLRRTQLFLLRDHINMLTDLGRDWSSGPPSDYHRFIPMHYVVELDLHDYELNTYVNDHNIIDKPLIKEDNAILALHGMRLSTIVQIPLVKFRPEATTVSFRLEAPDMSIRLTLPRWNTYSLYPTPDRTNVGRIGFLSLDGSYRYHADVREYNVDQLKLDFAARDMVYKAFGWTIRHFMILRENYFGSFTHFCTLSEYLEKKRKGQSITDPTELQYRPGKSNSMEVEVGLYVDGGLLVLPAALPGFEQYSLADANEAKTEDLGSCLILNCPILQLQLRTNDYFMEMSLNVDTVAGHLEDHCSDQSLFGRARERDPSHGAIILDELDITANRLFGLQPKTATYVCIWEIHAGSLKASLSAYQARLLSAVGSSFGLNFSDPFNAPAKDFALPVDPDVTFIKVSLGSAFLIWLAADSAIEMAFPEGVRFDSNDLAGKAYMKVMSVRVPSGYLKALNMTKEHSRDWHDTAGLTFDVNMDVYSAPPGWQEKAQAQTSFVNEQDSMTGRAACLYTLADAHSPRHLLPSGRGLVDSDIYLPQLRVPHHDVRDRVRPDRMQRSTTNGSGPWRTLPGSLAAGQLSESEGDEGLPENMRDARLASSRPPGSSRDDKRSTEEESMQSGDESDDEDLTESAEWDSDESDELHVGTERPIVYQYRELIGHYKASSLRQPALWDSTPYVLSQKPRITWRQHEGKSSRKSQRPVHMEMPCAIPPEDHIDTTVIRLSCSRGVDIWVTPLVIQTAQSLLHDFSYNQLTPELRFDTFMVEYVRFSTPAPGSGRRRLVLDAQVRSLTVACGGFVAIDTAGDNNASDDHTAAVGCDQPKTCAVLYTSLDNGDLGWTHTVYSDVDSHSALTTSLGRLSVALSDTGAQDLGLGRKGSSPSPAAVDVKIGASTASITRREVALSLGAIEASLEDRALGLVESFVTASLEYATSVLDTLRQYQAYDLNTMNRLVIHRVVEHSRQRTIVDPLSTIQPSYLVQKGLPDQLRRSNCFKFLVYLRSCLRSFATQERREVLDIPTGANSNITLRDLHLLLEDQAFGQSTDEDTSGLPKHAFMEQLFYNPRTQVPRGSRGAYTMPISASLHLGVITVNINHTADHGRSTLVLGPLNVGARVGSPNFLPAPHLVSSKSYSNLASTDRRGRELLHIALSFSLQDLDITIMPQMIGLAQRIACLPNTVSKSKPSMDAVQPPGMASSLMAALLSGSYIDVAFSIHSACFSAAAERLSVEFGISHLKYAATALSKPPSGSPAVVERHYSMNHSLLVEGTSLRLRSRDRTVASGEGMAMASFDVRRSRCSVTLLREPQQGLVVRVVSGVDNVGLMIPRSALNLYRSVDDWKAAYLASPQGIHSPSSSPPIPNTSPSGETETTRPPLRLSFRMACGSAGVTLQIARGTWFSWEVQETVIDLATPENPGQILPISFGLQAGPHVIGISTKSHSRVTGPSTSHIRVELPVATLKGQYSDYTVHGVSLVETFHLTVKLADWDTLLSVYQKSEQGFNDLIHLVQETRPTIEHTSTNSSQRRETTLGGSFRMKGFRIGVEGHSSTVFLECDDISGSMENQADLGWQIRLTDLSLSLASRASSRSALDRGHRSAFVTIDFEAKMKGTAFSDRHTLEMIATKFHAVMQPTSVGELSDFVDHLQAEVLVREADRASELAQFKEKTKNIMRSFDVKSGDANDPQTAWLDQYNVYLTIRHIGIAFPLAAFPDLQMSRSGSQDDATVVRAFLFSIKSVTFGTEHGESGQATMKGFSFQFVSRFRQSVDADFGGESHHTQNRMLYPEMTAQVRSERSTGGRRIRIAANVSGFILDLDPSIPYYVFSLVDVYRQGRERMDQLASNITWSGDKTNADKQNTPTTESTRYDSLPSSNMLLSLKFSSGKVRMHSTSLSETSVRGRAVSGLSDRLEEYGPEMGVETFDLPVVTVWGEYRAGTRSRRTSINKQKVDPSVLMFKATIHSSQNILRPTLLPFVTKIVSHVENRLRQSSRPLSQLPPTAVQHIVLESATGQESVLDPVDPVPGLKISLCLRIDQSRLELTCQPDVNVIAGLHWDSGGFIVNISPGFRRVSFTGSVAGLTVALKHGFLSEDCVKLDARNLAFNVTFAKTDVGPDKVISSISVVVDTEFSGGVRFSRLQDVLCFKAVWLDRIPVLSGPVATPATPQPHASQITSRSTSAGQELTTAILLRFRSVNLDADLGQSISYVKLRIDNMLVRTKLCDDASELTLSIAQFAVLASGNVSGQVTVPNFEFQTIRHGEGKSDGFSGGRMLDLTMRSGVFNVDLESEYQKLIQYRAEPVEVKIFDDWSKVSEQVPSEKRHVDVAFTVSGTEVIIVMNVRTIPKLVSYADKFKATLDSQREGASKESKAFRIASSPKPDNPLSAVANAMLKSTRSRLREETGVNYKIGQRMSLRLDVLRLVVFPRSMRDSELAQFVGRDVHARLDRMVEVTALPAKRDLELSFSSMSTSRISQLNHAMLAKENLDDCTQWLLALMKDAPEATIFGLPSMDIRMNSEENLVDDRRTLAYDFSSRFTVKEGAKNREDIYITLNMSLYTWLTSLRKAFTREMQQAQAAGDVRGGPAAIVQQVASSRKRAAESAVAAMRADEELDEQIAGSPTQGRPHISRATTLAVSPSRAASPKSPKFPMPLSPTSALRLTSPTNNGFDPASLAMPPTPGKIGLVYEPRERHIERLTMRQLGEATPDVMHPFFMKKAGFSLEDSLPQYVHEYATMPTEEIMKALLKLYSKQLTSNQKDEPVVSV
ncbi:uncharacterized protein C8Q71DRAFT_517238 [Rhodofomes roseus]|uniref:Csf1 N-terminal domain-containing protein n=1 Tax=Rhodofomes roseus TaxID=34475 RepID=A0ABQ8KN73_9APHY|nr:uncharacterized protein C8Q71DRAFT_517238 [Rhodofomes roseus]KAH9839543.1 hypothetical protein C8Q71DRAFT_517238 [Rhodofomes roseus]